MMVGYKLSGQNVESMYFLARIEQLNKHSCDKLFHLTTSAHAIWVDFLVSEIMLLDF